MAPAYPEALDTALDGVDWPDWLERLRAATDEDGYAEPLGGDHAAIFVEHAPVLLVSFENFASVRETSPGAQPVSWELSRRFGWSSLSLICRSDTWFRESRVYGYFDRLVDEGFFDEFEQVLFYGAGACGYAAAAFSVAAPGAQVLLVQPQATLDPDLAGWDGRFRRQRRRDFTSRYGYGPDMLDACDRATVLYDPEIEEDAMHAALYARPGVTRLRARFLGPRLDRALRRMDLLAPLARAAADSALTETEFATLFRARRTDLPYIKAVLSRLEDDGRLWLNARLAHYAMRTTPGPRFRRSARAAYARAAAQGTPMPPREEID
ncbi:MAG: phosphoadenosine phosphosulfate reductase [Pseudomonadota bacterium]